jgi:hypothetical protein
MTREVAAKFQPPPAVARAGALADSPTAPCSSRPSPSRSSPTSPRRPRDPRGARPLRRAPNAPPTTSAA